MQTRPTVDKGRYNAAWRANTCLLCDERRPFDVAFWLCSWYRCQGCLAVYCWNCSQTISSYQRLSGRRWLFDADGERTYTCAYCGSVKKKLVNPRVYY